MILTSDVKNATEVVIAYEMIPFKRLELSEAEFNEWIKTISKSLEFDFKEFL